MEPLTTAWILVTIFLCLPMVLVPAFYVVVTKEWRAFREFITITLTLVTMGIFIGFVIAIGLSLLYVLLGQIRLGGRWTHYFDQIVFSNGLVGGLFVAVLVLSGASALLIPAIRQERESDKGI